MKRMLIVAASCFIVAAALDAQDRPASVADRPSTDVVAANKATVQKYCVGCHNEKVKSGGLTLSTLDLARAPEHAEVWEHVIRKVRTGAMPPVGRPRPDKATAETLVSYLENELDRAALEHINPGRPSLQRLN